MQRMGLACHLSRLRFVTTMSHPSTESVSVTRLDLPAAEFEGQRPRLKSVAYRMIGSLAEAARYFRAAVRTDPANSPQPRWTRSTSPRPVATIRSSVPGTGTAAAIGLSVSTVQAVWVPGSTRTRVPEVVAT